ncbi:peroxiredoxin [Lacinutrix sp. Hel_I_90]|uniref:peroxiredoxin family protein n=1 Tax=Lacinutrix sp. Hel_I_90 TaxID=1249999 RepID=UPI000696DB9D|nr:TlpA disulfide reductase family protein [Lacinutrix sp. Hel_I_90]
MFYNIMCYFKFICIYCAFLFSFISNAQDYTFIPENQQLLSDEQVKTMQIMISTDVILFNEQGEILPMSQIKLMTNPEYKPLFYVDIANKIKTVVFKKKSNLPVLVKKNPEAKFTKDEKALDFIVSDLKDKTIKLSELKGKVVVLNFWFTKCGPCIQEMPDLNALVKEFKDDPVVFLAITFNKKELVEQFLEEQTFDYSIAANANNVITIYGVQSYPTSMVINKKGEIVLKELGYRTNIQEVLSQSIKSQLTK